MDSWLQIIWQVSGWDKEDSTLEDFDASFSLFEEMAGQKTLIVMENKFADIDVSDLKIEQLIAIPNEENSWNPEGVKIILKGILPKFKYKFKDPVTMELLDKIEEQLREAMKLSLGVIKQNNSIGGPDLLEELDQNLQIFLNEVENFWEFEEDEEPVAIAIDPSCDKICVISYKKIDRDDESFNKTETNAMLLKASKENYPRRYV